MNAIIQLNFYRFRTALLALLLTPLATPAASINRTWIGSADGNWATAANWSPSGAPVTGSPYDSVWFSGANNVATTNNIAASLSISNLTFAAGNFSVNGSSLIIRRGITNQTGINMVNVPVTFANNPKNWDVATGSEIAFTGGSDTATFTGNPPFEKFNGGNVRFKGANVWAQGADIAGGAAIIDTGSLAITNDGLRLAAVSGAWSGLVITNNGSLTLGAFKGNFNLRLGDVAGLAGTNELNLSSGQIVLGKAFQQLVVGGSAGTLGVVNQNGGSILFQNNTNTPNGVLIGSIATSVGTYNLNGGILSAPLVYGGLGSSYFNFNGGTLRASSPTNAGSFFQGLTVATIQDGGATIDTAGYNLTIPQALLAGGTGGLTKTGNGVLTLTGANTYLGTTLISAGKLILPTSQTGGGAIVVADNAALGVTVTSAGATLHTASLTLGSSAGATSEFYLGAYGNPTAPVIAAGSLTVNGTIIVNVAGAGFSIGQFPLVKYTSASGLTASSFQLNSVPAGVTASVYNNVANASVDLVITAAPALVWTGAAGGAWDISASANWYDPIGLVAAVYTDGTSVRFDDTATGPASVTLAAPVAPGGVAFANNTLNYELTGAGGIAGSGAFTKTGAGTVIVGTPNTYAGNTTISSGTLQLGASEVLPNGAGKGDVIVGGKLDLAGYSETINGLSGSGVIDASTGNSTLTIGDNNGVGLFSGVLNNSAGTLTLVKNGTGTITLTGNNTFSGGTTVNAGQLQVGNPNALGAGALTLSVPSGGVTLSTYGGAQTLANPVTLVGAVATTKTVNFDTTAGDLILNNSLTSSGQYINKFGPNAVRLNSTTPSSLGGGYLNLYQGDFVVDGAVWVNTEGATRFFASGGDTVRLIITNGASYTIGAGGSTPNFRLGLNDGLTGTNEINLSSGELVLGQTAVQIYVGDGAGTRGIVNQTGGTVSFVNTTNPGAGLLLGSSVNSLGWYHFDGGTLLAPRIYGGSGSGYFYFNGGTLRPSSSLNATNFISGLTAAYVGDGGAIIDVTSIDLVFNQALLNGGAGGLTKLGTAALTLTGTNTYTGPTVISAGELWLPTVHAGGGPITVADAAALGVLVAAPDATLNTAALTLGSSAGAASDFNFGAFPNPLSPVVNAASLTVHGTIAVNIKGSNLTPGQFPLIKYGSATGLTGASFQLASLPPSVTAYLSNNVANSSLDLVVTTPPTLVWTGAADSSWDLSGVVNWFDSVTAHAASYADGASVRLDDSATGATAINLNTSVTPGFTVISNATKPYSLYGGSGIAGIGGLTKDGAGTVIVGTPNTYASNTVINAGIFQLGANEVIPDGTGKAGVTVNANGKLDLAGYSETINGLTGSGVVDNTTGNGSLTVGANNATGSFDGLLSNSGGSLSLTKTGTGTLTLTGNNSFNGGTTLAGGRLEVGHSSALGAGGLVVTVPAAGATLATISSQTTLTNPISITGTLAYPANFDTTGGDLELAGPVTSSAPDVVKLGTNALRFAATTPNVLFGGKILLYQGDLVFDGTAWTNYGGAIRTFAPSSDIVHLLLTNQATLSLGAGGNTPNLRLGYTAGFTGTNELDISSGLLLLDESFVQIIAGDAANTYGVVKQDGGTVLFQNNVDTTAGVRLGSSAGSLGWYCFNGGYLITPRVVGGSGSSYFYFNGGTLQPSTTTAAANFFKSLTAAYVGDGGANIDTTNIDITISQPLLNGGVGGLTKYGSAALTLTGDSTYAGPTVVANGILAVNGSIGTNAVTVSGSLAGTGVINGAVTITAPGTFLLGDIDAVTTGITTVSNNVTIAGNLSAKLNKSLTQSNDVAVVIGSLVNTGTGTLTLTNVGPELALGDSFKLFNQPLVNGGNLSLAPAPGSNLAWQNNLAVDGTVVVVAAGTVVNPVSIGASVAGDQLTLSWPADHTGWKLQVQTNAPGAGLGGNWVDVPDSTLANHFVVPIDAANASVFFRLAKP